jgi:hypothetical protein
VRCSSWEGQWAARADASCESARAAKLLKRLKMAMEGYWKKLAWIWVRRHVRLGLARRPFGVGAAPSRDRRDHSQGDNGQEEAVSKKQRARRLSGGSPLLPSSHCVSKSRLFSIIPRSCDLRRFQDYRTLRPPTDPTASGAKLFGSGLLLARHC